MYVHTLDPPPASLRSKYSKMIVIPVSKFFGLASATTEELIVFQSGTGRNIGAGIFVWIMTFLGERKILGIFLLCWIWAGIADSKLLYEHPHGHKVGEHMRNCFILLVLGPLLIRSSMS